MAAIIAILLSNGSTIKPTNNLHIGDNINLSVVSIVERLSSSQRINCIRTVGNYFAERSAIFCSYSTCISEGPLW